MEEIAVVAVSVLKIVIVGCVVMILASFGGESIGQLKHHHTNCAKKAFDLLQAVGMIGVTVTFIVYRLTLSAAHPVDVLKNIGLIIVWAVGILVGYYWEKREAQDNRSSAPSRT